MCLTEDEVREWLKDLPDTPEGLVTTVEPGDFHGVVEWDVLRGRMMSFKIFDHPNLEAWHTHFSKNTTVSWHTHGKESYEMITCIEGDINILFEDGNQVLLKEKDSVRIEKQVKHMATIGNKPCEIVAMTIPKEKYEQ